MLDSKTTLIVSAVVPSLFLSLIIIVTTFAIIVLLKKDSEKKNGKKRKQSEPGESLSLQQGISNHIYYFESGVLITVLIVQNLLNYMIFVPCMAAY